MKRTIAEIGRRGTRIVLMCSPAMALFLFFACLVHGQTTWGEEIARSTPEEQGVDSEGIVRMLMEARNQNLSIDSLIIIRNDHLVAEVYRAPYTRNSRHILYSATKSFNAACLGIAIGKGLVGSLDDKVVDLLGASDWPLDARTRRMTLRHLLTMSTGHTADTTNIVAASTDWVKSFLSITPQQEPGSLFVYNSGAACMISAITQRASGMTTAQFAAQNLFPQLGITDYQWDYGPNSLTIGGWGLYLRPYDMAKFGLMYLHHGVWDGRQFVPSDWVEQSSRKQVENGTGGMWGSGYGFQFWINDFGGYRADGSNGQYIFILPDQSAVIVMTSNVYDMGITNKLVSDYLIPALSSRTLLPGNPKSNALLSQFGQVFADATSAAAKLPIFTTLPESQTPALGGSVLLSAAVSSVGQVNFQWLKDGIAIEGANAAVLSLTTLSLGDSGAYTLMARNTNGESLSLAAHIEIASPPAILVQPAPTVAAEGRNGLLQVQAGGAKLSYQWERDGVPLPDTDSPTFCLATSSLSDEGSYRVKVTNTRGSIYSDSVALNVAPAQSRSHLASLSARALAGPGEQTLIVGLVIEGSRGGGALPIVLRGVGPGLAALGMKSAMLDPAAALFSGSFQIGGNGDWAGDPVVTQESARIGLTPLDRSSEDAALFRTLAPGAFTLHITSSRPDSRPSVAMAEIYDVTCGHAESSSELFGLSARALVQPEDGTLIAGFAIEGEKPLRVLLRGLGPELVKRGIANPLADPELLLYSGSEVVATNDDWIDDPALRAAFASAYMEAPAQSSKDSAMVVTLQPGLYTAHVRCKASDSGVALVEVYALPQNR